MIGLDKANVKCVFFRWDELVHRHVEGVLFKREHFGSGASEVLAIALLELIEIHLGKGADRLMHKEDEAVPIHEELAINDLASGALES